MGRSSCRRARCRASCAANSTPLTSCCGRSGGRSSPLRTRWPRSGCTGRRGARQARSYSAVDQWSPPNETPWGLGQRQYALFVEVVTIEDRIAQPFWHACDATVTPALDGCAGPLAAATPMSIDNHRSWPALCGTFAFTHERAAPARSAPGTPAGARRVVDVAVVRLACDG